MTGPELTLPLSADVRARLRPSVNVAALERLLAALPPAARWVPVLACYVELTRADVHAAGLPIPEVPVPGPAERGPAAGPAETARGGERRYAASGEWIGLRPVFDHPSLRVLWAAIEAREPAGQGDA